MRVFWIMAYVFLFIICTIELVLFVGGVYHPTKFDIGWLMFVSIAFFGLAAHDAMS